MPLKRTPLKNKEAGSKRKKDQSDDSLSLSSGSTSDDKLCSSFVEASLREQLRIARIICNHFGSPVYVYDKMEEFSDVEVLVYNNHRYLKSLNRYGVLSLSAQSTFTAQQYKGKAPNTETLYEDEIGVYIIKLN